MKEGADEEVTSEEERSSEEEEEEEEEEEGEGEGEEAYQEAAAPRRTPAPSRHQPAPHIPEAVDDFLRNFLRRAGLSRTLQAFEAEWYGSARKLLTGALGTAGRGSFLPDAAAHGLLLRGALEAARGEAGRLQRAVLLAAGGLRRMQRESDFHRLQRRRAAEQKARLLGDWRRLKGHLRAQEPALRLLEDKRRAALSHKMLLGLEKDRLHTATEARSKEDTSSSRRKEEESISSRRKEEESSSRRKEEESISRRKEEEVSSSRRKEEESSSSRRKEEESSSRRDDPSPDQRHPEDWEPRRGPLEPHWPQEALRSPGSFSRSWSFRAHQLPISCIDLHPQERLLATASDDHSWRLWELQANGEKVRDEV